MPIGVYQRLDARTRMERMSTPEPNTGCVIWTGAVNRKGYGVFTVDGGWVAAHRAAWILENGAIPTGLHVLHRCDVPGCVNTAHLFLGTAADNVADKVAKGRQARGDRSGARTSPDSRPRGERHPMAKLTVEQVRQIRKALELGATKRGLARTYGVNARTIDLISKGTNWRGVE